MKYNNYLIYFSFILFLFLPVSVKADVFSIHFHYNTINKELSLVNNEIILLKEKYVLPEEFQKMIGLKGEYDLTFYEANGSKIVSVEINPQNGEFSVEIPYLSLAGNCVITNNSTQKVIGRIDLSTYIRCNRNNICEFEKGENVVTCMPDCVSDNVKYSKTTLDQLKKGGGVIKDNNESVVLYKVDSDKKLFWNKMTFAILLIAFLLMIVGLFFAKREKGK
jgi:hypothetical protein